MEYDLNQIFPDDDNLLKRKIPKDDEFQQCLEEVRQLERKRQWDSSKKLFEDFLEKHPLDLDNEYEYHYFSKPIEQTIFFELFEPEKEVIILKDNFYDIFMGYVSILRIFDEYSKAKSYLKLAHDLNPVRTSPLFVLAQIYDNEYEGKLVEKTLKDALAVAQDTYDLFETYGRLADYYEVIHEDEISQLLRQLRKKRSFEGFDKAYVENLFNRYGIQLGFNPKIIDIYHRNSVSAHFNGSDEYGAYYDYWELAEINLFFEDE
ncbi:hypothetical protein [Methanobrevibacter sp.]|uniref:hypothetical protein n=1 Tax=Methanobrevibacter sp. TaxID=66852 RepID=UPI00388DC9F1